MSDQQSATQTDEFSAAALLDFLRFHADCGVDECLSETPINHFEVATPPAPQLQESLTAERHRREEAPLPQVAVAPTNQVPEAEAVAAAQQAADGAKSVDELRAALEAFSHCSLKRTANATLFAAGPSDAKLVVIGDAPGRDDDRTGDLFAGDEGRLLDAMLRAIGLSKDEVYLTCALPWRPPGNRQPTPAELAMCAPFLRRHMELIKVPFALGFGALPHRMFAAPPADARAKPKTVMQLRGSWTEFPGEPAKPAMLTTLTPRYLLQQPAHKRLAWQDLLALQQRMPGTQSK
ncbi:MAG: uracil-DNA glycosylase [Pseudomonadota bacterium]